MDFIVSNWPLFVECFFSIIAIVCFIITYIRTGNIKKSISDFREVYDMKYKTVDSERKKYNQSFTPEVKDYLLNSVTNELEELPKKKNVDDYIQSHIESCLERALERFLPKVKYEDDLIADYTERCDDLASLGEAIEMAEYYREKFGLSDSASIADIYSAVDNSAKVLKTKLSNDNVKKNKDGGGE